jgi:hypothetical protein
MSCPSSDEIHVAHYDDAVAEIDRIKNRCEHANVGFRARDDQRVRLALPQVLDKTGFGEGGIACFLDDGCGRAKRREWRPRQDPVHPRRRPRTFVGKNPLYVYTEVALRSVRGKGSS